MAAVAIDPAQTLVIGGAGLATSAYLRLFLDPRLGRRARADRRRAGQRHAARRAGGHAHDPRVGRPDHGTGGSAPGGPGRHDRRAVRGPDHADAARRSCRSDGRHHGDAGRRRRGRPGDRRDGLDRPRPQPARRAARGLRARVPGLRDGRRDAFRGDPIPPLGGASDRCRAGDRASRPDRDRAGVAGGRRAGVGRLGCRAGGGRPDTRAVHRARHRGRHDRARRGRRVRPGRPGTRARLLDRRRRRGHRPRPRGRWPRRAGARPDMDPRVHRRSWRVRGLGGRDPGGLLHGPRRRPARLGTPLAAAPGRVARGGCRQRRLPGSGLVRRAGVAGRPGGGTAGQLVAPDRDPRAAHLLRAAAGDRAGAAGSGRRTGRRVAAPRGASERRRPPTLGAQDVGRQPGVHDGIAGRAAGTAGTRDGGWCVRWSRCGRGTGPDRRDPGRVRPPRADERPAGAAGIGCAVGAWRPASPSDGPSGSESPLP